MQTSKSHNQSYISHHCAGLKGEIQIPADKSISHRAFMMGALGIGTTKISYVLEGEDVLHTKTAMESLGAQISKQGKDYYVKGVGIGGLKEPSNVLDFGNSGTGARLTMGICASYDFNVMFTGDASLCSRPMKRILDPLESIGAASDGRSKQRFPLLLMGAKNPMAISYETPMASAQVKSAILLAGLNCPGETHVTESVKTRDHTEKMLRYFGADIKSQDKDGKHHIKLCGHPSLMARPITVPSDPSSASFAIVAALITPESEIFIPNILLSPERTGLLITLIEMGGHITKDNIREEAGEMIGDIHVKSSALKGVTVPPSRASTMIDEYPILTIAAAVAEGITYMRGIAELRVKESDRIAAMAKGLVKSGVYLEEFPDGLHIKGGSIKGGCAVETFMDHRIAMSFLVAGMVSDKPITIDNGAFIATSFPDFFNLMKRHGANILKV